MKPTREELDRRLRKLYSAVLAKADEWEEKAGMALIEASTFTGAERTAAMAYSLHCKQHADELMGILKKVKI